VAILTGRELYLYIRNVIGDGLSLNAIFNNILVGSILEENQIKPPTSNK
jgi:hypothetical protein